MVELRLWEEKDAVQLHLLANDSEIAKFMREGFPSPFTLHDAQKLIKNAQQAEKAIFRAIYYDNQLVGSIALFFGDDIYRQNAELAYWIGISFHGRGIASKAIKSIIELGFSFDSIKTIFAKPYSSNIASQKLLEKCGFNLEAHLKDFVLKDGVKLDELIYVKRK